MPMFKHSNLPFKQFRDVKYKLKAQRFNCVSLPHTITSFAQCILFRRNGDVNSTLSIALNSQFSKSFKFYVKSIHQKKRHGKALLVDGCKHNYQS